MTHGKWWIIWYLIWLFMMPHVKVHFLVTDGKNDRTDYSKILLVNTWGTANESTMLHPLVCNLGMLKLVWLPKKWLVKNLHTHPKPQRATAAGAMCLSSRILIPFSRLKMAMKALQRQSQRKTSSVGIHPHLLYVPFKLVPTMFCAPLAPFPPRLHSSASTSRPFPSMALLLEWANKWSGKVTL